MESGPLAPGIWGSLHQPEAMRRERSEILPVVGGQPGSSGDGGPRDHGIHPNRSLPVRSDLAQVIVGGLLAQSFARIVKSTETGRRIRAVVAASRAKVHRWVMVAMP